MKSYFPHLVVLYVKHKIRKSEQLLGTHVTDMCFSNKLYLSKKTLHRSKNFV